MNCQENTGNGIVYSVDLIPGQKNKYLGNYLIFVCKTPDLEYVMIDATIIRAHACAAGYGDQEQEGLGRSKGGFTSKIHAKVDALGNPLKIIITSGQRHDITQAKALLKDVTNAYVIADRGYDSKIPWKYDKYIYKERHAIECFFSKIKQFRRVFSRFDKSSRNFASFLAFVGACLWLR